MWTTDLSSFSFDTCLVRKDGASIWVHVTTIIIEDNGGRLGYTILEDISARKELERVLKLVKEQEQRQQIAETILNTQEEERRRIAESLHNGLGQLLYGVKLSLSQLIQPGNEEALRYSEELITESIIECRRISHDLMPAVLMEEGLKVAVETICEQLNGEVKFSSRINGLTPRLPSFLGLAIYRIIQELLMNIIKHARADKADIQLEADESAITIRVRDNGQGFDATPGQTKGIGLQTMRYKVGLLSGTFDVMSEKGSGTTVAITIPRRVD